MLDRVCEKKFHQAAEIAEANGMSKEQFQKERCNKHGVSFGGPFYHAFQGFE